MCNFNIIYNNPYILPLLGEKKTLLCTSERPIYLETPEGSKIFM